MLQSDLAVREYPEHPKLGRKLAVLDPSSLQYAAVGVLVGTEQAPRTKTWRRYPPAYDQGQTSECTCYSGKGLLNTAPLRASIPAEDRLRLDTTKVYNLAQRIDIWPGEDYDGTSVLAATKALKQFGLINGYRWCFGLDDVLRTVSWYGPVQIGVSWYNSMFQTNAAGFINVDESSGLVGGHAVQIIGINVEKKYVIIVNSWGTGWGVNGRCYMTWDDLGKLLPDWGEALTYITV